MGGILPPAGLGQEAATAEKPAAKPRPATGNVARALARTAKLEFKDTPLQEALDRISTQYRVEIILCNRALAKEHISPDDPVTERIHGVKLDKGLGTLLKHQNLTYAVCDNAILVTTAKQAEVELITRVYPLSLPRAAGRGGNPAAVNAFLNEVQATLTQKILPKSWDSVGWGGQFVRHLARRHRALVVGQTRDVQKEVAALLSVSPVTAAARPAPAVARSPSKRPWGRSFPSSSARRS